MSGIYQIRNIVTNKVYVGSTKNFELRKEQHFKALRGGSHSSIKLQRSYNKHGKDAFVFEVLEILKYEKNSIIHKEQLWMDYLDSQKNGYNIASSSFGDVLSFHPNRETIIEKIALAVKKRNAELSPEERKKRWSRPGDKNPMYGKSHTPAARQKISESRKGKPSSLKGIKLSQERCSLLSENAKKRTGNKNPFYGKTHSPEVREKLAQYKLGSKPTNTLQVVIDDCEYKGLNDASLATGIKPVTIRYRCLSVNPKYKNFYYKDYTPPPKVSRKKRYNQKSPNRRSVSINGVVYESVKLAIKMEKISSIKMYDRLKSPDYPEYFYL